MQYEVIKTDLRIYDCGTARYKDVLRLQHDMCRHRWQDKIGNTILIVEHQPVITLGARDSENKLLIEEDRIKEAGIDVQRVRRGGGTTAHNPGQIVLYPIIKLKSIGIGVNEYIRELEAVGIELLESLGVHSERKNGYPGLWVGEKKIASIGVQLIRWVAFHGIAINIQNDLSIFDMMIPCGINGVEITSVLKETDVEHDMDDVKQKLKGICKHRWAKES